MNTNQKKVTNKKTKIAGKYNKKTIGYTVLLTMFV